jgi:hypothetical protein
MPYTFVALGDDDDDDDKTWKFWELLLIIGTFFV